jgi:hypothetical protein
MAPPEDGITTWGANADRGSLLVVGADEQRREARRWGGEWGC